MSSTPPKPMSWWRRLECRLDAWAAKRMTPEEYAEALVLDRKLKANFWRWLGQLCVVIIFTAGVVVSLFPHLGPLRALVLAAIGCTYVAFAIAMAWYGYRKFTKRPPWKVFTIFVGLVLGGAVVGFIVGNVQMGRPLADFSTEKAARAIAIALALGFLLAGLLVGVAHLRLREAEQAALRLEAEAERERLARQGAQAELKLLQAQVEPHFLFNTLSNLRYLVQTGSRDALPMLDHLIHYLRTALPEIRTDTSTLGREVELARAYLEIMKLRMGGALEFEIDLPAAIGSHPLPPLMVMTLVENAIKHGVAPLGKGRIVLRARESGGTMRIEVEDDGRGLAGPIGRGVGLGNIRERLRALHGERARLELKAREPRGTVAAIEVPA